MKLSRLVASVAVILALAACGGGGSNPQPLSIDESAPHAYTQATLASNPDGVPQPEHLLIVRLDPTRGDARVSVWIPEPMTLSLAIAPGPSAVLKVAITDASGVETLSHQPGQDVATATLPTGVNTIVFTPDPNFDGGRVHTLYLKLADTAVQAAARQLLGASPATQLGRVSTNNCLNCSFANSDLTGADFSGQVLNSSTFDGANLHQADFSGVDCEQCLFTNLKLIESLRSGGTTFRSANLKYSTVASTAPNMIEGVRFNGAQMGNSTLIGRFMACDFGPTLTGSATGLQYADLTKAFLQMWNNGTNGMLRGADISNAKVAPYTFSLQLSDPGANPMFVGARLDGIQPSTAFSGGYFKGFDLSGVSLAAMDLSSTDLSIANGVVVSARTDISRAILTNGKSGVNLAGQQALFATPFNGWAGTIADQASGWDLRFVNLSNISLSGADLTRANLSGATLIGTDLSYANLYGASLRGALLGVAPGTGTAAAASLNNAYMPLADFSGADLRSVSLQGVHLYGSGVQFNLARLDSADFTSAYLMSADFTQASLNDTNFSSASLVNATFSGATLTNTKFDGAYLQGVDLGAAAGITGVNLNNAAVSTTTGVWQFTEIDGTPFSYQYAATALGAIATSSEAICPSGALGPCTGGALTPVKVPPYPVQPKCIPLRKYQYKNCEAGWTPPSS